MEVRSRSNISHRGQKIWWLQRPENSKIVERRHSGAIHSFGFLIWNDSIGRLTRWEVRRRTRMRRCKPRLLQDSQKLSTGQSLLRSTRAACKDLIAKAHSFCPHSLQTHFFRVVITSTSAWNLLESMMFEGWHDRIHEEQVCVQDHGVLQGVYQAEG